jgi:hypothetical protein
LAGIESFSKLGDSIYFLEEGEMPGLYIVQYIPSTFNWKSAGLAVKQQAKPLFSTDTYFEVSLTISAKVACQFHCRHSHDLQTALLDSRIRMVSTFYSAFTLPYMQGDAQLAKVSVRIPSWTSTDDATATLNGQKLNLTDSGNSSNGIFTTILNS